MISFPTLPHPTDLQWRVGAVTKAKDRCTALAYTDSRAIFNLLDERAPGWSSNVLNITSVGQEIAVTVALTIEGVTRTDIGQDTDAMAAQSRGLKRAAMQFGIYRGLWELPTVWVAYDAARATIADTAMAALKAAYERRYTQLVVAALPAQIEATSATSAPRWSTMDDYKAAKSWAASSGKFNAAKHLDNAWAKVFKEYEAHLPSNAGPFLAAWVAYVEQHEAPA